MIARIRQSNPDVRIILLSGFVEPLGLTAENTGADVVISKSANEPAHLARAAKRLLQQRRGLLPHQSSPNLAGSFQVIFDPRVPPESVTDLLSALADLYRGCGGVGLKIEFDTEEVPAPERLRARA
jgi:DNA-binding NarL/FixJ family response regulator